MLFKLKLFFKQIFFIRSSFLLNLVKAFSTKQQRNPCHERKLLITLFFIALSLLSLLSLTFQLYPSRSESFRFGLFFYFCSLFSFCFLPFTFPTNCLCLILFLFYPFTASETVLFPFLHFSEFILSSLFRIASKLKLFDPHFHSLSLS